MSLASPLQKLTGFQEKTQFESLRRFHQTPHVSQRELDKDLGVVLGTINFCFQGLVKVQNFSQSKSKLRYAYALTPDGAVEKIKLTAEVKTIVSSSSATVYGEPPYLPLDEIPSTRTTNPYGRSKLHIEEMLNDISESDSDWRIACLRYFNPMDANETRLSLARTAVACPITSCPISAKWLLGQRAEMSMFGDDYPTADDTGVRNYINAIDLAERHATALRFLSQTSGWYAINLGTGKGYSVLDMAQAFENTSGRLVPYKTVARRAGDVAACYAVAPPPKDSEALNWRAIRSSDTTYSCNG